jgi:hypothetical protein
VVVAFVVGAVLFGGAGYLIARPDAEQQAAESLRQADAQRDKRQIAELTALARDTGDQLAPVLEGLAAALPPKPPAAAAEVAGWQRIVDAAAARFDDPPSGMTATNVARGSLTAAVDQLAVAVDLYPADLVVRQRDLALTMWSVGATQLDQINVDAGNGHQHVFLPGGELTADDAPEGSGHR